MAKKVMNKKQGVSNEEMFEVLVFLKDKVGTIEDKLDHVTERVDSVEEDTKALRVRVDAIDKGQEEILDTLRPLSKAHDKDAGMLLGHERRIRRLEKMTA